MVIRGEHWDAKRDCDHSVSSTVLHQLGSSPLHKPRAVVLDIEHTVVAAAVPTELQKLNLVVFAVMREHGLGLASYS